ncbi:MAG TPA: hypothetical protein VHG52_09125 [Thermomicrobiales bacterium]|nr:hypothetical protein [Thermomicrobiales bacterium]
MADTTPQGLIYIWLDNNPDSHEADVTIDDVPGVSDLDLIAEAMMAGGLGRYLPTTIQFATHPEPQGNKVRSVDTARLLRDRAIPHVRRYEITLPDRD